MADPVLVPPIATVQSDAESGYFFRRIGEIAFTAENVVFENEVHHAGGPLGRIRRLAVASRYGIVIFADFRGDLLLHSATWNAYGWCRPQTHVLRYMITIGIFC